MNVWQVQMELGELAKGRLDKGNHTFIAKRLAESPAGGFQGRGFQGQVASRVRPIK